MRLDLRFQHFDMLLVLHNRHQPLAQLLELLQLFRVTVIKHLGRVLCFLQRVLSVHATDKLKVLKQAHD